MGGDGKRQGLHERGGGWEAGVVTRKPGAKAIVGKQNKTKKNKGKKEK